MQNVEHYDGPLGPEVTCTHEATSALTAMHSPTGHTRTDTCIACLYVRAGRAVLVCMYRQFIFRVGGCATHARCCKPRRLQSGPGVTWAHTRAWHVRRSLYWPRGQ